MMGQEHLLAYKHALHGKACLEGRWLTQVLMLGSMYLADLKN